MSDGEKNHREARSREARDRQAAAPSQNEAEESDESEDGQDAQAAQTVIALHASAVFPQPAAFPAKVAERQACSSLTIPLSLARRPHLDLLGQQLVRQVLSVA